ncbi:hypothetical protein CN692_03465 [Bacillus sp. AFS002410]|uniref:hypothetical protein n=1 Tax=Bacillus sp. AFS002410 TaxID=2033481 RepID=UPI000BF1D01E|nr:hypothetical protein [Bacillus sp. AFS002410]PEJ60365.1 hypothetical protein CN692_03465 [Bacillus sp. AFS002410]
MNSIITKINESDWHDWEFEEIKIDYSNVTIVIESSSTNKTVVIIICKNHIGFDYIGHWDEAVIEDINIDTEGDLIEKSLSKIKSNYGDQPNTIGNERDFQGEWLQVNIQLIDGVTIKVVCQDVDTLILNYN